MKVDFSIILGLENAPPERRRVNLESLPGIESGRVGETSAGDRSFSFVRFRAGAHLETELGAARHPVNFIAEG